MILSISRLFKSWPKVGVYQNLNDALAKKIILTNQIILLLIGASLPYIILFFFMSKPIISVSLIFVELAFISCILMNHFRFYTLSRLCIFLFANFATFFYSTTFGEAAGVQILFFSFVGMPLVIFEILNEKVKIYSCIAISMILFFILHISHFRLIPSSNLASFQQSLIFYTVTTVSFIIIILYINFLLAIIIKTMTDFKLSHENELKIIKHTEKLSKEKEAAIQRSTTIELESIQKTVALLRHKINNILVTVVSGATFILESTEKEEIKKWAAKVKERGHGISKLLLKLSKIKVPKDTVYYIGENDTEKMLDLEKSEFTDDIPDTAEKAPL